MSHPHGRNRAHARSTMSTRSTAARTAAAPSAPGTSRGATASGRGRSVGAPRSRNRSGAPVARAARQPSDLELKLDAAQLAPAPPETTFRGLGLPEPIVAALSRRGIRAPFAIQVRSLPDALAGYDILGRAQTGSGKTLAFGLPMLARLASTTGPVSRTGRAPRGLVLVPTRELARQVAETLDPLAQSVHLSVTTVYGGAPIGRQIERLRAGTDVVVATPGRLLDLLDRGALSLDAIAVTVLDEADHMADLGFLPDVSRILDATPAGGQRMLFSATLDRGVERVARGYLNDPVAHAVAAAASPVEGMAHLVFTVAADDKVAVTAEIATRPARTLIFVATKHGADRLVKRLEVAGVPAAAIHGNRNQSQRTRTLAAFADGSARVLVATDVAARGIHVDDVDLVVHYDLPRDDKGYLHRSGRTARAGKEGTVVSLVEGGQAREMARIHLDAGVSPVTHAVRPGHEAVRDIATSGEPIAVVARPAAARTAPARTAPARTATGRTPTARTAPARSAGARTAPVRSGPPTGRTAPPTALAPTRPRELRQRVRATG